MPPTTLLLLAAAVAVALLLLLHLRLSRRQERLHIAFQGLEQDRRQDAREADARLGELRTMLQDVDERVRPVVEGLEERIGAVEAKIDEARSRLGALDEANEAAAHLAKAREKIDALGAEAEARFEGIKQTLDATRDRAAHLDVQLARVRDVLGERIGGLEHRVAELAGRSPAARSTQAHATATPTSRSTPEIDDAGSTTPAPPRSPAVPDAPTMTRVFREGFTFEGEPNEPPHPALKGVLMAVLFLAGVAMLLHALGVGR